MILELFIGVYAFEAGRMLVQRFKERNRQKEVDRLFVEALDHSDNWGDLMRTLKRNEESWPELYEPVPQTWLYRFLWRKDDED